MKDYSDPPVKAPARHPRRGVRFHRGVVARGETLWTLTEKGGGCGMKLLDAIIKLLHYVAVAGTYAAVLEMVLKAIFK